MQEINEETKGWKKHANPLTILAALALIMGLVFAAMPGEIGFGYIMAFYLIFWITVPSLIVNYLININTKNKKVRLYWHLGIIAIYACLIFWFMNK